MGADLVYGGQSGGINEAYSDIVGECFEFYLRGSNDWMAGADMVKEEGAALRYLYHPPLSNSIDDYSDFYEGMNVHFSSGVYTKAAYILRTEHEWSMRQLFVVFSTANLFYWTADSRFDEVL